MTREDLVAAGITVDVWPVDGCKSARYTIRRDGKVAREVVIPFAEVLEHTLSAPLPDMDPRSLDKWAIRRATMECTRRLEAALRQVWEDSHAR